MVSHIILNVCAKCAVESMVKGIVAVANLGGVLVELNHILHDSVSVVHPEIFEGILSISDGIKGTKVGLEFVEEGDVGVLPCRWVLRIWGEDVWFKPVEGGARETGNGIVDFTGICCKCGGSVIKVQLEGDNESLEFPQVGAIKSIRFLTLVQMLLGRGLFNEVEMPHNRFMNSHMMSCLFGRLLLGPPGPPGPLGPPGRLGSFGLPSWELSSSSPWLCWLVA